MAQATAPVLDSTECRTRQSAKSGQGMKKRSGEPVQAVAYLRTSSATNIGADKDSDKRQEMPSPASPNARAS